MISLLSIILVLFSTSVKAHFHASHLAPVIAFFTAQQNESTRLNHPPINLYRDFIAVVVALYLAWSGFKKRSLSFDGAITAFFVGYASLSSTLCGFGVLLIVFYLIGSKATKVKHYIKYQLEDGHDSIKPGGVRNTYQVLANSYTAVIASIIFRIQHLLLTSSSLSSDLNTLDCILNQTSTYISPLTLYLLAIGHYSCCTADTLASELGILSSSYPRLITNPAKVVPPGTNGGVSSFGTLLSAAGGSLIGLTSVICLAIEDSGCFGNKYSFIQALTSRISIKLIILSSFAGLLGSLLDSLMGATLQRTLMHKEKGKILTDGSDPSLTKAYEKGLKAKGKQPELSQLRLISGKNILSNTQVNVLSSLLTSIITVIIGNYII